MSIREAFFWFLSTQGRRNGWAGAKKTRNRKEAQRRSDRRPKVVKNRPFKKKHATFASFDTNGGGLTGTKKGFPNELIALRATADTLEDNVLAFRLNLKSNAL